MTDAKNAARCRERNAAWKLAGLCRRCGAPRFVGLSVCEKCAEKNREYDCKRRQQRTVSLLMGQRKTHWKIKYGLTWGGYLEILKSQGGKCGICGSPDPGQSTSVAGMAGNFPVDHDHLTNQVRGLLCHKCNLGLGLFGDDPEMLLKAISYLRSPPTRRLHVAGGER